MSPVRAMCFIFMKPDPKTMALGGVATGRRNEQEAMRVTGRRKKRGSLCKATAIEAMMGRKVEMVAVLEVSSVVNQMIRRIVIRTRSSGQLMSPCARVPMYRERPEDWMAAASESPPPKRMKMPQGSLVAYFQSMRKRTLEEFLEGMIKRRRA